MKIHHLIYQLMLLLAEHPEAKDFNILRVEDCGCIGGPPGEIVPQIDLEAKEIRL